MRTDRSIPEEAAKAKAERELGKSSAGIKVTAIVALILGDRRLLLRCMEHPILLFFSRSRSDAKPESSAPRPGMDVLCMQHAWCLYPLAVFIFGCIAACKDASENSKTTTLRSCCKPAGPCQHVHAMAWQHYATTLAASTFDEQGWSCSFVPS